MIKKNFGEILRKTRQSKGLSQSELAQQTGVTKRSIIFWEQGASNITLENADKLLKALGVEITIGGLKK